MPGRDAAGPGTDGAGAAGEPAPERGRIPSSTGEPAPEPDRNPPSTGKPAPEPGRIAFVRQRRYLVEEVAEPGGEGAATLVHLSCLDDDAQGQPLAVLWEHELDARILEDDGWRAVAGKGFDEPALFAAYLRTLSWNCVTATDPNLFQAPFRAGIRIDAYQLEPLWKALRLPRVNLFIADDVGLGKTIEAGLIARELLLRRRVDRIVVACPPSMLEQWRDEMEARFGLTFTILDRTHVARMRRERGFAVNPWTTHSRFLVSHRLLIDETYASGLRDWLGRFAPQSLLILDEAHHAAPSSGARYAIDSQTTRAVRDVAPRFEHRLFLSATPHNGHSNSFSALLEILDPQRFCRGVKVLKGQLDDVMVRRLKSDVRALEGGFPKRTVMQIDIDGLAPDAPELVLAEKLDAYRLERERRLAGESRSRQAAGALAVAGLQKRLLSSIEAFAKTLAVHRRGVLRALEEARDAEELPDATLADLEAITAGVDPDAAASETDGDGLDGAMAGQDDHGGGPSPDGDQEEHDHRSGLGARDGQKGRAGRGGPGARDGQKGGDGLGGPGARNSRKGGDGLGDHGGRDSQGGHGAHDGPGSHGPERELAERMETATIASSGAGGSEQRAALQRELALADEMQDIADANRHAPDPRIRSIVAWIGEHLCPGLASDGFGATSPEITAPGEPSHDGLRPGLASDGSEAASPEITVPGEPSHDGLRPGLAPDGSEAASLETTVPGELPHDDLRPGLASDGSEAASPETTVPGEPSHDGMRPGLASGATSPPRPPRWNDRRVILFTEYEDTRRYLERCLREAIAHTDRSGERIAVFAGTTSPQVREDIKHAFNTEPKDHPLRILIATDAAREGLNLQRHCADLYHFDLPWNPSRLDQRNGRIDRKLQPAGEVFCRYFFYRQRPEDRVLKVLVEKAERIRAELGSAATVLEGRVAESMGREGVRRDRLAELADSIEQAAADDRRKTVEEELEDVRARRDGLRENVGILERRLERSRRHIGLTAAQFRRTLSVSLRLAGVPGGIRELPGRRQRSVLAVHDRPAAVDAGAGTPRGGDRPPPAVYGFEPPVPADTAGPAGNVIDGGTDTVDTRTGTPRGGDRPPPVVYDFEPPVIADTDGFAGDLIDGGPEAEYDVPHRPPPTFEFPAHRILVRDPGWTAALDTLRERRRRGESAGAWRRRAGVRPVAFEDTGRLGDKAVHLHLEHRVAQRLLSRFTAQGLIHHDLSKACLAATPGRDTRVVLLGRLAVYGRHAARLHEEVVPVTARWIDPARRSGALAPYGRAGEQTTLAALQAALDEAGDRHIPEPVQARFAASAEDDVRDLKPHLQRRADGLIERVKAQLAARAEAESDSMRELLERQHTRIVGAVRESRQMAIDFDAAERRQHEADRRAWDRRLKQIEEELESEPRRIAETWTVRAVRVDPVGIVYLWPPGA